MDTFTPRVLVIIACTLGIGCASHQQTPLIFGQQQTIGISLGGGVSEQGADFTLGYKDKNVAIVPVAVQTKPDEYSQVGSSIPDTHGDFEDSFSVLGQFSVDTNSSSGDVGLGKFFATGSAAKALADGFGCKLADNPAYCGQTTEPPAGVEVVEEGN